MRFIKGIGLVKKLNKENWLPVSLLLASIISQDLSFPLPISEFKNVNQQDLWFKLDKKNAQTS